MILMGKMPKFEIGLNKNLSRFAPLSLFAVLAPFTAPAAISAEVIEEVVVTGSRVPGRTATDSAVPIDVVGGEEFENMGSSDMDDMLRNLLPSYNVSRYAISDAATLTRPANMRGLPPDNTLVLVNGKRRHRASVIAELGGSLSAGSQGADVSVIPAIAIQQVEVLRDGAAAQYGSDAIAGVLNFKLKENAEGSSFEIKTGEYFEGDGALTQVSGNVGLPLGDRGFASVSLTYKSSDATSRSTQRTDAIGLIAGGNTAVGNPAQIWGAPEVDDDYAFFINAGIDLTDSQELYGFANYAERKVTGGFFFRNPNNRSGVFSADGNRAIMDTNLLGQTGQTSNCPVTVATGLLDISTLPANCQVANSIYPGGYTPAFGGSVQDSSIVGGVRGSMKSGMNYDVSYSLGSNESNFRLSNSWNPSLGITSPQAFNLGKYVQTEHNFNFDFSYPIAVDAFASDLNIAFGAEYRVEEFEIRQGEEASWKAGDFAFQNANFHSDGVTPLVPMSIGAHGFAGFSPSQTGEFDRANYAFYVDLEADVTDAWLMQGALRFEDFDGFGTTTNFKVASRYSITDALNARASYSTGFRAPTPGQSNVTKVSTITVEGVLQQRGQIPPTNPIAGFLGAEPLKPEDATNVTLGIAWDITDDLTVTADWFQIELEDRISQTGTIAIAGLPVPAGVGCTAASSNLAQCLQELGIPGAADLASVSFFTNDFATTTTGIDIVATYAMDWNNAGSTTLTGAWNMTQTDVDNAGTEVSRERLVELENFNAENRGIFTAVHTIGNVRLLGRASFYGDWVQADGGAGTNGGPSDTVYVSGGTNYQLRCQINEDHCYDAEWIFDLEAAYTFNERYTFVLGANNVFDESGPLDMANLDGTIGSGNTYEQGTPYGYEGGFYYARFRVELD
ncbi:MAG: iron complex outermembrane receptor protein [Candidatus Azotimanducaceae bacterium]|jgi:iron complex outermembrane receptor protein